MTLFSIQSKHRALIALGLSLVLLLLTEPAMAAETSGGGLPFDSWLTKISNSITGPFAFTVSIVGIVGAGAALIFGGDMNGFLRTLLFIVLVLSFTVAAKNMLTKITGKGAEIGPASMMTQTRLA